MIECTPSEQIVKRVGNPYTVFCEACIEMGVEGFSIHPNGNLSFVVPSGTRADKLKFDTIVDLLNHILWRHLEPDPQDEDDD